jgi:hypothetical protein
MGPIPKFALVLIVCLPLAPYAQAQTFARVSADRTNTTTTFADVTNLTFSIAASTNYAFTCEVSYTTAVTTTALQLSINGPASPTAMRYTVVTQTTATAIHSASQSAYDTVTNPATGGGATALPVRITGVLENGANAGTLAIRFRSEIAASVVTVQRGSFCTFATFTASLFSPKNLPTMGCCGAIQIEEVAEQLASYFQPRFADMHMIAAATGGPQAPQLPMIGAG